jgi:hypothetical protein
MPRAIITLRTKPAAKNPATAEMVAPASWIAETPIFAAPAYRILNPSSLIRESCIPNPYPES